MEIWPLRSLDYQAVADLWQQEQGIVVRDFDDSEAGFDRMIRHNPYLCLGLWEGEQLVGAALTGFDGRRAYIYHFMIAAHRRRNGLGKQLAAALDQAMSPNPLTKRIYLFCVITPMPKNFGVSWIGICVKMSVYIPEVIRN